MPSTQPLIYEPAFSSCGPATYEMTPSPERMAFELVEKTFLQVIGRVPPDARVAICGAGTAGRLLALFCRRRSQQILVFLDDFCEDETIDGIPVQRIDRGLEDYSPNLVILATLTAAERMKKNLVNAGFDGTILVPADDHHDLEFNYAKHVRSPPEAIRTFHNIHAGRRAFIVCNGPSLLKTSPERLNNEITLASNNIYLIEGFQPTYYFVTDSLLAKDRADEINRLPWTKFYQYRLSEWLDNGYFIDITGVPPASDFSTDFSVGAELGGTVTYFMLQAAYYFGCDPVYIIGADHSYVLKKDQHRADGAVLTSIDDDPNHFHPGYFGRGYRWHDPQMDNIERAYQVAREAYGKNGRRIYNAGVGGQLEIFDRIDFDRLLGRPER